MAEAQQEIEFEESENEENVEVDLSEKQEQSDVEVVDDAPEEKDSSELEQYSEGVQKRISKLTAKMREAERREKAALTFAQATKQELDDVRRKTSTLDNSYVAEFENRVTAEKELWKSTLKEAIDRGDIDAQVEAQGKLGELGVHTERLAQVKTQRERQAQQPQQPQQLTPYQQQLAKTPPPPDPKASDWASKNEWFGTDEPMTLTAFSIHKTLVDTEGYDPQSDEYYNEVDRRMRTEFPHKFGTAPARNRNSGPAVASANRGSTRSKQQKIKLTKSEVAIADKLGVSYEQYARQKQRLQTS
tara:strand:+ start:801 stop:1706 length:906 start_codon:yes stop_codon:yes gene_type:complete